MAETQQPENSESSQTQANSGSTSVGSLNVGRDVGGNVTVGNNNTTINNYYQQVVQQNVEKRETEGWYLAHPYPMPPNFTGRIAERATLTHWLKEDSESRLFILRALGGFGKSALTWHWLTHDVDIKEYPKVVFWSFYEGDANFEHFIEETLKYLKLEVPQGGRPQVDELLKAMQGQKILLIMDGCERVLRLYASMNAAYQSEEEQKIEENELDCKDINAEWFLKSVCAHPNIKSKVLMTTRLTPRVVIDRHSKEIILGCREIELTSMQPADAVEFFHKQKIKGTRAEIETVCAAYGYHPLSLRILAGLIINDRENPGDIAVADHLDITDNIIQNKNHVLKVAYDSLSFGQQKLLSNMACFRSSISYQALKFIISKPSWRRKNKTRLNENLDVSLQILESHGQLSWERQANKYHLHPIVRRYAYEHLSSLECVTAHARLRDYFVTADVAKKPQNLEDLAPVIELYHHTVRAGELDKARKLFAARLHNTLFYQLGAYESIIELMRAMFSDGEAKPPRLDDESAQGWSFAVLANSYIFSGQPDRAILIYESAIQFAEKLKHKHNIARGLGNIGYVQLFIGDLHAAESNLQRHITIDQEIHDSWHGASGNAMLGLLLGYRGMWNNSAQELNKALDVFQAQKETQMQSFTMANYTLRAFLISRDASQPTIKSERSAIQLAKSALILAEEQANKLNSTAVDFVRAHWLLGAAYYADRQINFAENHLNEALTRCRAINYVIEEANILLDLARLRYVQKNYEEAKSLADEALSITERCGYVLQGADVNLFLAQYVLEQEKDKAKAKGYAEEALKLATCDGPPYYYKVAYEEAERMLKMLNAEG